MSHTTSILSLLPDGQDDEAKDYTNEQRLWLQVLLDALHFAQRMNRGASYHHGVRVERSYFSEDFGTAREVEEWIKSEDLYIGSFTFIAQALGEDEDQLRMVALNAISDPEAPKVKTYSNLSHGSLGGYKERRRTKHQRVEASPRYDQAVIDDAIKRYKAGQNMSEIARSLGVYRQTVTKWLKKDGCYSSKRSEEARSKGARDTINRPFFFGKGRAKARQRNGS